MHPDSVFYLFHPESIGWLEATDGDPEVPDGVIHLTREAIQKNPPDFLFLSLEMLHRELGNPVWAKAFGIGSSRRPGFSCSTRFITTVG